MVQLYALFGFRSGLAETDGQGGELRGYDRRLTEAQSGSTHFQDIVASEVKAIVMGCGGWALCGLRLRDRKQQLPFGDLVGSKHHSLKGPGCRVGTDRRGVRQWCPSHSPEAVPGDPTGQSQGECLLH